MPWLHTSFPMHSVSMKKLHNIIKTYCPSHSSCEEIWSAKDIEIKVNEETLRASSMPRCPHCKNIARPNILSTWFEVSSTIWEFTITYQCLETGAGYLIERTSSDRGVLSMRYLSLTTYRYEQWISRIRKDRIPCVVKEIGAGTAVPSGMFKTSFHED